MPNQSKIELKMASIYPIGLFQCNYVDFCQILSQFPPLKSIERASAIKGPFDGKINSIYRIDGVAPQPVIFRARISRAFRYEPIVKEKILYPLLDGTITMESPQLRENITQLTKSGQGSYQFQTVRPPVVPVQDLLYYYEPAIASEMSLSQSSVSTTFILPPRPFPYLLTIKSFIAGTSLYDLIQQSPVNDHNSPVFTSLFEQAGEWLAKLHTIHFDAFYDKITDIGAAEKPSWGHLFQEQWRKNLADASQYKQIQPYLKGIERYYKDHLALAEDDTEAVLFHNDYQSQNLIVEKPSPTNSSRSSPRLVGVIDFDNWRIGPRAQDFVKMEYWTIQGRTLWKDAFYNGYSRIFSVTPEMQARVQLYTLLWFLLVFAFEMDKVKKSEVNLTVDQRFPAAEKYINEIKTIVSAYL